MKYCFWLLFALLINLGYSQALVYSNSFEEKAFQNFSKGQANYLQLLIAASGRGSEEDVERVSSRLEMVLSSLNPDRFQKYSSPKKVKKIFTAVQDQLLVKYQLENQFLEVFETGMFNCVSSAAIYALLLEHFSIPYYVVEEPGHVYVVANPEGERIVMEGTDPQDGYVKLNEKIIENQLDALVSMKVITEEERNSGNLGRILDDLYPSESIDLIRLVAIQYYNQAIYDYEAERYVEASQNALKANFLSKDQRYRAMGYTALGNYLSERNYYEKGYAELFLAFAEMDSSEVHIALLSDEFHTICYKLMIDESNVSLADSIYDHIKDVSNEELKKVFAYKYNYLKGLYLTKSGYISEARVCLLKAAELESGKLEVLSVFTSNVLAAAELGQFPNLPDTIKAYEVMVPALKELKLWQSGTANALLLFCYHEMGLGNVKLAKQAFHDFETLMESHSDLSVAANNIGVTYCRVALNAFKSSKSEAMRIIDKGLKYAPGNSDLLRMRNVIN